MNTKKYVVLFQLLLAFCTAHAQKQQWQEDPLYSLYKVTPPARGGMNAFLIADDTLYDFTITGLAKLNGCNVITAFTTIDESEAHAVIISPRTIHARGKKLRYKESYRFSIHRYWQVPIWEDIEETFSTTLLLGKSVININRDGVPYLFISKQLKGLYIVDDSDVTIPRLPSQLGPEIKKFVQWMTYDTSFSLISDFTDTSRIMKTFKKFKDAHYRRTPDDVTRPLACVNAEWGFLHEVKNQGWMDEQMDFSSAFREIIHDDYNPCRNFVGSIDTIAIECIYGDSRICTMQVAWSISGTEKSSGKTMNKTFVAIINIRKRGDVFKIVGFNRPFGEYLLLSDKLHPIFFHN